jgi:hypothetical protein
MSEACNTNEGEKERIYAIGGKARGKEIIERARRGWVNNARHTYNTLLRYFLGIQDLGVVIRLFWLRIATSGGLL